MCFRSMESSIRAHATNIEPSRGSTTKKAIWFCSSEDELDDQNPQQAGNPSLFQNRVYF